MQVVLEFDFKREAGVMDTVADNLKVGMPQQVPSVQTLFGQEAVC